MLFLLLYRSQLNYIIDNSRDLYMHQGLAATHVFCIQMADNSIIIHFPTSYHWQQFDWQQFNDQKSNEILNPREILIHNCPPSQYQLLRSKYDWFETLVIRWRMKPKQENKGMVYSCLVVWKNLTTKIPDLGRKKMRVSYVFLWKVPTLTIKWINVNH